MTRWTLLIPSNQLYVLNEWDPELRLQAFKGKGTDKTTSKVIPFEFGTFKEIGTRSANLKYLMENGEVTVNEIYEKVRDWVPDASFESLTYVEKNCKMGNPDLKTIRCDFERETIQHRKLKKLVVDGAYPMEDMHRIINEIKNQLEDLPEAVRSRFRPSCMILSASPDIHDDGFAIQALKRSYHILMEDRLKRWLLRDLEYKSRGGPRV